MPTSHVPRRACEKCVWLHQRYTQKQDPGNSSSTTRGPFFLKSLVQSFSVADRKIQQAQLIEAYDEPIELFFTFLRQYASFNKPLERVLQRVVEIKRYKDLVVLRRKLVGRESHRVLDDVTRLTAKNVACRLQFAPPADLHLAEPRDEACGL